VWREKPEAAEKKGDEVPTLKFTEESLLAMQDHFEAYPAREGEDEIGMRAAAKEVKIHQSGDQSGRKNKWPPQSKAEWKKRCEKSLPARMKLPSFNARNELLEGIRNNQVVLVSGETGCGKTTQVPQFIMDDAIERGVKNLNMICTQPRRIAAISVAERVASERGERIGDSVGYTIRLESRISNDTCLTFCTTGVLLRRLTNDRMLKNITHIILDEVHERDRFADFAMIFLRELLPKRPDLRVILMSATLTADLFKGYFYGCPVVHIPGFTHPVQQYWLEEALLQINYGGGKGGNRRVAQGPEAEAQMLATYQAMNKLDEVDCKLVHDLVRHIHASLGPGAVLVFLPGWDEIMKLRESLGAIRGCEVLCLHSMISAAEQRRVFQPVHGGKRKVVLATNIAETSITIDDIVYVINSGRHKEKSFDSHTSMSTLQTEWISKNSERQRKGRAGRCQPGVCYHLFSKMRSESLPQSQVAELLRTPLEELSLQVQLLQPNGCYPGSISDFLAKAVEAPVPRAISSAVSLLQQLGALTETEGLTILGKTLADMPVHPRMGKMVLLSLLFDCLDPILTIACGSGQRDPFVVPSNPDHRVAAKAAKSAITASCRSDQFTFLRCYDRWAVEKENRGGQGASRFCSQNYLSNSSLEMAHGMRSQLINELGDSGFLRKLEPGERRLVGDNLQARGLDGSCDGSAAVVSAVLCAGAHPNIAQVRNDVEKLSLQRKAERMKVHQSSCNTALGVGEASGSFVAFDEAVRGDGGISVRSTTVVPATIVSLLAMDVVTCENSDDEEEEVEEGEDRPEKIPVETVKLDGWCKMRGPPGVGSMIRAMRSRLEQAFLAKMQNPLEALEPEHEHVVATAQKVFADEARQWSSAGFCEALNYKTHGGAGGEGGSGMTTVYQEELKYTQVWSRTEAPKGRGGKGGKGGAKPLSTADFASEMDRILAEAEAGLEEDSSEEEEMEMYHYEENEEEADQDWAEDFDLGQELGFESDNSGFASDSDEESSAKTDAPKEQNFAEVFSQAQESLNEEPEAEDEVAPENFHKAFAQAVEAQGVEAVTEVKKPKKEKKPKKKKKEKTEAPLASALPIPAFLAPVPLPAAETVSSADDAMALLKMRHQQKQQQQQMMTQQRGMPAEDSDDDDDICFVPS